MQAFNRLTAGLLAKEIEQALQPLAEKHGITIARGNASFDATSCSVKVVCNVTDEDGNAVSQEATDFTNYANLYGLAPADLGRRFVSGGRTFTITGLKSSRPKYPICAKDVQSGKGFKFPAETVKFLLSRP